MTAQTGGLHAPDRGDIVKLNYEPVTGREIGKVRPALVLSPKAYNRQTGFVLICPISTKVSGYPFEVALPVGGRVVGAVLADRVNTYDWRARKAVIIEKAAPHILQDVKAKLVTLLP